MEILIARKSVKIYKIIALMTFNTIILIVLLNLILMALLSVRGKISHIIPLSTKSKVISYREKYSDINSYSVISNNDANQYLDEQDAMGSQGFGYAPWVQFRNPEFQGKFLNTNAHGFRKSRAPRNVTEKPIVISVFGGSTTFGYGVPDDYTIPSYMQTILENKYSTQSFVVQNYGQGYYYSSQKMLLLLSAIKDGNIPDIAVFIDGANDTYQLSFKLDQPYFTDRVSKLWDSSAQRASPWNQDYSWIPMVRVGNALLQLLSPKTNVKVNKNERDANYVVSRYLNNMKMIQTLCNSYNIKCFFIWQPIPFYKYDLSFYKNPPYGGKIPSFWSDVYRTMKDYSSLNFLYLGELLEHTREKVFVDDVHYNEKYNELIAMKICDLLQFDQSDNLSSN